MIECNEIIPLLNDFVDDELATEEHERVACHLESCETCQAERDAIVALKDSLRALPRSITPEPHVWEAIESRIQASPVSFEGWIRKRAAALAYAAAVAAAVVLFAALGLSNIQPVDAPRPANNLSATSATTNYDAERSALRAAYAERTSTLDPELRAVVDENLAIIDQSVDAIRAALADHPEDVALERMLYAAVRSEANLLHQAVHGTMES